MSETPAQVIRRAAAVMRERAEAVIHVFPWRAEGRDVTATQDYDGMDPDWDMGVVLARCTRQDEAEHIASWHPLVAAAVADWLERAADDDAEDMQCDHWDHALKVALAYLGEAS